MAGIKFVGKIAGQSEKGVDVAVFWFYIPETSWLVSVSAEGGGKYKTIYTKTSIIPNVKVTDEAIGLAVTITPPKR